MKVGYKDIWSPSKNAVIGHTYGSQKSLSINVFNYLLQYEKRITSIKFYKFTYLLQGLYTNKNKYVL